MDFALVYLVQRFFYRIFDFFHHWYIDGSREFLHRLVSTLSAADQTIAFGITLRHFFEPLYKDYSIIERILGVIFRTGRIILGAAFYVFLLVAFAIAYILWISIPLVIIFYAAAQR
jgi:hypothetical protein